jgi:hypothetical protein
MPRSIFLRGSVTIWQEAHLPHLTIMWDIDLRDGCQHNDIRGLACPLAQTMCPISISTAVTSRLLRIRVKKISF